VNDNEWRDFGMKVGAASITLACDPSAFLRSIEMLSDDMWELVKTIEDMQRKQAEKKKAKEKAGEAAHFAKQAELQ